MGCPEGVAPSDSRFTTWGLRAFGIGHTLSWSGMQELHLRDVSGPDRATNYHALSLMVKMAGFEPAAPRSRSEYSDQTELHPDGTG